MLLAILLNPIPTNLFPTLTGAFLLDIIMPQEKKGKKMVKNRKLKQKVAKFE